MPIKMFVTELALRYFQLFFQIIGSCTAMLYALRIADQKLTHHRDPYDQGFHLHPWLHCIGFHLAKF